MKIHLLAEPEIAARLAPLCRAAGWPLETRPPEAPHVPGLADVVLVSVLGEGGPERLRSVLAVEDERVEVVALARVDVLPELAGEVMASVMAAGATDVLLVDSSDAVITARLGFLAARTGRQRRTHNRTGQLERRRVREFEERHALALRGAGEVLFDWDIAADRLMLSTRFWELLQLIPPGSIRAPGHLVDIETWLGRLHPVDAPAVRARLQAALEDPHCHHLEVECRLMDGTGGARWMLMRALVLRAGIPGTASAAAVMDGLTGGTDDGLGHGPAYRMAGSMAEVTGLKRAQEELARARDEAVAASTAKSQFLANMSHELRTPLASIIGYSEMLIEDTIGSGDPEVRQRRNDLERIRSAGAMLLDLINGILDISKIEAGRMELHLELIRLEELLEVVAAALLPACDRSGNRFEVRLPEQLEPVRCDTTKLRQVLLNLLANANKFTQAGTVTLEVEQDAGRTLFRVQDTGIGIAPEVLPRLFQPFVQGDASTTRHYGGTGLGLAISRRLCRLMGGDLTVQSQPGAGTTFEASLPRDIEAALQAAGQSSVPEPTAA
jgi:signal transduction histidine kinase